MRRAPLLALLAAGTLAAFLLSLMAGKVWIAPWGLASGSPEALVMAELRLPRALLGLVQFELRTHRAANALCNLAT